MLERVWISEVLLLLWPSNTWIYLRPVLISSIWKSCPTLYFFDLSFILMKKEVHMSNQLLNKYEEVIQSVQESTGIKIVLKKVWPTVNFRKVTGTSLPIVWDTSDQCLKWLFPRLIFTSLFSPPTRIKKIKNFKSTVRLQFLAKKRGEVQLVNHSKSVQ